MWVTATATDSPRAAQINVTRVEQKVLEPSLTETSFSWAEPPGVAPKRAGAEQGPEVGRQKAASGEKLEARP